MTIRNVLVVVILLVVSPFIGFASDLTDAVKRDAESCGNALLKSDYERVASFTHQRVIKLMGGKEAMLAALKRSMTEMHSQGFAFLDVKIGEPSMPKRVGAWLTSIVPQTVVMKVPDGRKMSKKSHLLGFSEDAGRSWVFFDLSVVTDEQYAEIFPELVREISLPAKKKAVVED